jgi:hypothetical protein
MNLKRFVLAIAVYFIASTVFDILVNAVLLRQAFIDGARFWRPAAELNRLVWLGWLSLLLIGVFFGILFVRTSWRGTRRGLEFGAWLALSSIAGIAGIASLVPWPTAILVGMAAQQVGNALILGWCLGALYRDQGLGARG